MLLISAVGHLSAQPPLREDGPPPEDRPPHRFEDDRRPHADGDPRPGDEFPRHPKPDEFQRRPPPERHGRPPGRGGMDGPPPPGSGDNGSTIPYSMRFALAEMRYLPTLQPSLMRMVELHSERSKLEGSRRRAAHAPADIGGFGAPSRIREYHGLLASEDRIGAEMLKTVETIRANADKILVEIAQRRNEISQRMDQLEASLDTDNPESGEEVSPDRQQKAAVQQEMRTLRRAERLHLILNDRISRLRDTANAGNGKDPMRRLVRGGLQEFLGIGGGNWREGPGGPPEFRRPGPEDAAPPPAHDAPPSPAPRTAEPLIEQRLNQYNREAEALRRRLKQIERDKEELQRLTSSATTTAPATANTAPR